MFGPIMARLEAKGYSQWRKEGLVVGRLDIRPPCIYLSVDTGGGFGLGVGFGQGRNKIAAGTSCR